jgi:hypothetical protein
MSRPGGLGHPGGMEIRISLDQVDPPAGRLGRVPGPEPALAAEDQEVGFTGWLGLLRALYQVVGPPDRPAPSAE